MALDAKLEAAVALHRFGFGPRGEAIARLAGDAKGALIADIERPDPGRIPAPNLRTSGEAARAAFEFRQEKKAARLADAAARNAGKDGAPNPEKPDMAAGEASGQETKPGG